MGDAPALDPLGLRRLAARIRMSATNMVAIQGFGYLGQALSSAEIFAVLFGGAVRFGHDRFVLSPGHYVISLYAVAAETGRLDPAKLATYGKDGAELEAIGSERTPVADLVCGSLGQGLSGAIGFALAALALASVFTFRGALDFPVRFGITRAMAPIPLQKKVRKRI